MCYSFVSFLSLNIWTFVIIMTVVFFVTASLSLLIIITIISHYNHLLITITIINITIIINTIITIITTPQDYYTMRDFEHVHVKFVDSPITARLKGNNNKAVTSVRPPFGTDSDLQLQLEKRDLKRCSTTSTGHRPVNNVIVDRYPTITNLKDHYSSSTQKEFRVRKKYFDPQAVTDKTKQLEHIERLLSHAPTRKQTPINSNSNGRRDRESAYTLPIIKKSFTNDEYDRNIMNYSNDEYDRKSSSNSSQRSNSSSGRKLERKTY